MEIRSEAGTQVYLRIKATWAGALATSFVTLLMDSKKKKIPGLSSVQGSLSGKGYPESCQPKLENVKGHITQLKTSFSSHSLVFNNEGRKEILSILFFIYFHTYRAPTDECSEY